MSAIFPEPTAKSAFGEQEVVQPTPFLQEMATFGISRAMNTTKTGTGSVTDVDSQKYNVESGTDSGGFSFIGTKDYIRYRAGQGLLLRFTAKFEAGVAGNRQLAGGITASNGICFGYDDTNQKFGILHRYDGVNESRSLTISTGASSGGNVDVTVDGSVYTIAITNSSANQNAKEIADYLNANAFLFDFDQVGNKVVMTALRSQAYVTTWAYDPLATGSSAAWATDVVGVDSTDDWYYQADGDWNGGADTSIYDWTKGNVFQIRLQYLGFGAISFYVEDPETGNFQLVHRIKWANAKDDTSFSDPAFRVGWSSSNVSGSTTNVTVQGASVAAFIDGDIKNTRQAYTVQNTITASTTETPVFTLKSGSQFSESLNTIVTQLGFGRAINESSKSVTIKIVKNATLTGDDYSYQDDGYSPILVDSSATSYTNGQVLEQFPIGPNTEAPFSLSDANITLTAGETITFTAELASGSGADFTVVQGYKDDF